MIYILLLLLIVILGDGVTSILIRLAGKDEKYPEIPSFFFNIFGTLTAFFFISSFPTLSQIWLIPLIAAFVYTAGNIFMFKAYKKGEVSLLVPLSNFSPAIVFIFSIILLQESITLPKIAGVTLIIYGMSFLKEQKSVFSSLKVISKDRNCQFYFLFLLVFSLARVIDKKGVGYFQATSYSFLEFFASTIFLLLLVSAKKEFNQAMDYAKRKLVWAASIGIVIGIKYTVFLKAISQVQLTIVAPTSSLSVLVALLLAAIFLKEKVKKRWWAAILMLLGAALLVYKI